MGFQHGLSGLNAASKNLDVIGHNIANSNTVGFKGSPSEFTDIVAASIGTGGGSNAGIGVEVAAVAQQFSQGNITITGNNLDVCHTQNRRRSRTRIVLNGKKNYRSGMFAIWACD
mgnify:CR=1 FL=1